MLGHLVITTVIKVHASAEGALRNDAPAPQARHCSASGSRRSSKTCSGKCWPKSVSVHLLRKGVPDFERGKAGLSGETIVAFLTHPTLAQWMAMSLRPYDHCCEGASEANPRRGKAHVGKLGHFVPG